MSRTHDNNPHLEGASTFLGGPNNVKTTFKDFPTHSEKILKFSRKIMTVPYTKFQNQRLSKTYTVCMAFSGNEFGTLLLNYKFLKNASGRAAIFLSIGVRNWSKCVVGNEIEVFELQLYS